MYGGRRKGKEDKAEQGQKKNYVYSETSRIRNAGLRTARELGSSLQNECEPTASCCPKK